MLLVFGVIVCYLVRVSWMLLAALLLHFMIVRLVLLSFRSVLFSMSLVAFCGVVLIHLLLIRICIGVVMLSISVCRFFWVIVIFRLIMSLGMSCGVMLRFMFLLARITFWYVRRLFCRILVRFCML